MRAKGALKRRRDARRCACCTRLKRGLPAPLRRRGSGRRAGRGAQGGADRYLKGPHVKHLHVPHALGCEKACLVRAKLTAARRRPPSPSCGGS